MFLTSNDLMPTNYGKIFRTDGKCQIALYIACVVLVVNQDRMGYVQDIECFKYFWAVKKNLEKVKICFIIIFLIIVRPLRS